LLGLTYVSLAIVVVNLIVLCNIYHRQCDGPNVHSKTKRYILNAITIVVILAADEIQIKRQRHAKSSSRSPPSLRSMLPPLEVPPRLKQVLLPPLPHRHQDQARSYGEFA
jgi:hypothetical protein